MAESGNCSYMYVDLIVLFVNSLFATYKSPVCHIILERTGIGVPFLEVLFSTHCIFLPVNRMEKPKTQINNACAQCEPETMGIAALSHTNWIIGVCITVQIGERGNFTDVQVGERGKQLTEMLFLTLLLLGLVNKSMTLKMKVKILL